MNANWISISPDVAHRHPLYGIGGWTILLIVGLVLSLLTIWAPTQDINDGIHNQAERLSIAQGISIDQAEAEIRAIPVVSNLVTATQLYGGIGDVFRVACLILLITRQRAFAASYTLIFVVELAFATYFLLAWPGVSIPRFMGAAIAMGLLVAYVWRSRRIRVTTRNEVRADDPILKKTDVNLLTAHSAEPRATKPASTPTAATTGGPSHVSSAEPLAKNEKEIYAEIAAELESRNVDRSLWTKAFAEADGDEAKTRAAYIRCRAAELQRSAETVAPTSTLAENVVYDQTFETIEEKAASPTSAPASHVGELADSHSEEINGIVQRTPQTPLDQRKGSFDPKAAAGIGLFVVLLAVAIIVAYVDRREHAEQARDTPGSTTVAPQFAAKAEPSIEDRLRSYESKYQGPVAASDDETRVRRLSWAGTTLTFEYELTPIGQNVGKGGRVVSDDALQERMVSIMCADPERRELLRLGARLRTILHRFAPNPDLVAEVATVQGCEHINLFPENAAMAVPNAIPNDASTVTERKQPRPPIATPEDGRPGSEPTQRPQSPRVLPEQRTYSYTDFSSLVALGTADEVVVALDHGASATATSGGQTPLISAARHGRAEIVGLLLSRGAQVDAKDANGNTAMFYAKMNVDARTIEILRQWGAANPFGN